MRSSNKTIKLSNVINKTAEKNINREAQTTQAEAHNAMRYFRDSCVVC